MRYSVCLCVCGCVGVDVCVGVCRFLCSMLRVLPGISEEDVCLLISA